MIAQTRVCAPQAAQCVAGTCEALSEAKSGGHKKSGRLRNRHRHVLLVSVQLVSQPPAPALNVGSTFSNEPRCRASLPPGGCGSRISPRSENRAGRVACRADKTQAPGSAEARLRARCILRSNTSIALTFSRGKRTAGLQPEWAHSSKRPTFAVHSPACGLQSHAAIRQCLMAVRGRER